MKTAFDDMLDAHAATPFEKMILDMRVKPGLDTAALRSELNSYIDAKVFNNSTLEDKLEYIITEYELNPH